MEQQKFSEILDGLFARGDKDSIFFLALDCSLKRKAEKDKTGTEHAKCVYFLTSLDKSKIKDKKFIKKIKNILVED